MNSLFPQDRSLSPERGRSASASLHTSLHCKPTPGEPVGRDVARHIAFACLYIHARMTQQPRLRMPVHFENGDAEAGHLHAQWSLVEDSALDVSLRSLAWSPEPDLDHAEVDITLQFGATGDAGPERGEGLLLRVTRAGPEAGAVQLQAFFDEGRMVRASVQDLLEKISLVCAAVDSDGARPVRALELVSPTAARFVPDLRRELLAQPQPLVPHVFRDMARRHWSEPAISGKGRTYSYGALWLEASRLAGQLRAQGLESGDIVAIAGASSLGTIAALLATLMAGGVIVTLDPALPAERLSRIAAICRPKITISVLAGGQLRAASAGEIVCEDWPAQQEAPAESSWADFDTAPELDHDASAYVFFTSGSTGEPKGVLGTHLGLAHFLQWQRSNFPIGPGDRNAQLTALSFDVVLRDIFFPLTSGACLCIPERDSLFDARKILRWMSTSNITVMHSVPSLMKAWLQAEQGERPFRSIRYIFFAGEPLTDTLLARFREASSPEARIVNLYGPTETTLAKLCNRIERVEPGVQPVGYPQPGVDAFVMRGRSVRCGLWEVGEIVIRTPYRSKGYLYQDELTRQVFIPNPMRDDAEDLIYCTGDLGRFRPDGKIEIFGRIDSQIKIRGVRIEPNEIESELTRISYIKDAAISARLNSLDEKFLVAFVILKDPPAGAASTELSQQIRAALKGVLHDAMVPSRFVFVPELPYLPNGKLNRKAIAALDIGVPAESADAGERFKGVGATYLPVIAQIETILGRPVDSVDQSFVDLGGDSLSYIRVSLVLEELLGDLPPDWEKQPLRALLDAGRSQPASSFWAGIEVPLLFRAVSILLVVLNHTGVVGLAGTTVLFVISGISFGKFLRPTIFQTGSLKGVFRFILRYGVPAALWQLLRSVVFHRYWLPDLFLLGTLFQKPGEGHWTLWYLDILTANLLLLSAIALLEVRRRGAHALAAPAQAQANRRFGIDVAVILLGVALAVLQVSTGWWDGELGRTSVGPFRWFWLLAYGVAVSQVTSVQHKAVLTGLLALPLTATGLGLPLLGPVFDFLDVLFYGAMLAILWIESVTIPRVLKGIVVEVASASLFIYIVNVAVISQILPRLGVPPWWPLQTLAAVVAGVVANRVWDALLAALGRWNRRRRALC